MWTWFQQSCLIFLNVYVSAYRCTWHHQIPFLALLCQWLESSRHVTCKVGSQWVVCFFAYKQNCMKQNKWPTAEECEGSQLLPFHLKVRIQLAMLMCWPVFPSESGVWRIITLIIWRISSDTHNSLKDPVGLPVIVKLLVTIAMPFGHNIPSWL